MLHQFLTANRAELIERCRSKVAQRSAPKATPAELEHGVPLFLDQLIKTLEKEQAARRRRFREESGPVGGARSATSEMGATATLHGHELLQHGFTVDQVVHDYGDLCQAVTELAFEDSAPIQVDEFRTLNRCLDDAIADAVTAFSERRDTRMTDAGSEALNARLGFLAHELRNHLHTAMLAVVALQSGSVGIDGATGAVLHRSLIGMRDLVDRSLADVRTKAGLPPRHQLLSVADFFADVRISASLEAATRECKFIANEVEAGLAVDADRDMLFSAVGNLLQNAFKFTRPRTAVTMSARVSTDRVLIEIADCCGGLPAGTEETMFQPFVQNGTDRSGLGLGLSICRRSVEANNGRLSARDLPGWGCVFTIDLPRHELAAAAPP